MRELVLAILILITGSFGAHASEKDSAAWWAKTKNMKKGFWCQSDIVKTYKARGKKIKHVVRDDILFFPRAGGEKTELPDYLYPCVNDKTLNHYYLKSLGAQKPPHHIIPASNKINRIESELIENKFLTEQLKRNEILSYLFYKNGKVVHDVLAPQNRFSFQLNDKTKFVSFSVGKSFTSYLVGHAICKGYISSVDESLDSYPPIKNTLYSELKLIDLLNMRARDQHVVNESDGFLKTGRWFNPVSMKEAGALHLGDTKPNRKAVFNYNGFVANLIINYMKFKTGDDWKLFLEQVFHEKIGTSEEFIFDKVSGYEGSGNKGDGVYKAQAFASRQDYLRLAVALLNDWKENKCMGTYLREIQKRKMPISTDSWFFDLQPKQARNKRHFASHYGGMFYFDFRGMEKRNILGMEGKGGQSVLIDLDNSRIVVINAASDNYDWYELAYQPIKTGKLTDIEPNLLKNAFNSLSKGVRKNVQINLKKEGFYSSNVDGYYGKLTEKGLKDYNISFLDASDLNKPNNVNTLLNKLSKVANP